MMRYFPKACADCGATFTPAGGGAKWCVACGEVHREERRAARHAERVAAAASVSRRALCAFDGCMNRINSGRNRTGLCVAHAALVAQRERKAALRASGTCQNCGGAPATGGGRCDPCRAKRRKRGRAGANRAYQLRSQYGLTPEAWDALFEQQGRCCAICSAVRAGGKHGEWHTDHDHATGAVRGILCAKCNWMLGHADDNPETLARAIEYLRRPRLALVKEPA